MLGTKQAIDESKRLLNVSLSLTLWLDELKIQPNEWEASPNAPIKWYPTSIFCRFKTPHEPGWKDLQLLSLIAWLII